MVEIELGKNSQFFVEITIRTRPPIYIDVEKERQGYLVFISTKG